MWQYQKLSTLIALGMVAICASTGCATTVEDPVVDAEETADITAENSEALTAGGWGRGGAFRGYGRGRGHGLGLAKGFRRGHFDRGFKGGYGGWGYDDYDFGDYGYGGYGDYGYGDYGDYDGGNIINQEVAVIVGGGGYGGYYGEGPVEDYIEDYVDYDDCDVGYGDYYGDYDEYDDWK
jgi:hypothetical protein